MSIKTYTNFEDITLKHESEGRFILDKDLFVISKKEFEEVDFGECHYDVMEVSIYDVNNNILQNTSGNTVAYIKSGDIKNYMYNATNSLGKQELAIDAEKLLHDLGFKNGILKININFVRNRFGEDDTQRRGWIQEISATRQEIRIVPLKVNNPNISKQNSDDLEKLKNLHKDFKYYRKAILENIHSYENNFLDKIDTFLENKFGKDFFSILKTDFGLNDFSEYKKIISEDFNTSVEYYLNNRYYHIGDQNFGQLEPVARFDDCEQYDFKLLTAEIQKILFECINHNTKLFKRRPINISETPKEFKPVELSKQIKDNLQSFPTPTEIKNNIYSPDKVDVVFNDPLQPTKVIEVMPVDNTITEHVIMPTEIVVNEANNHYQYKVENTNANKSTVIFLTFKNVHGDTCEKSLSSGQSITVCAEKDTLSISYKSVKGAFKNTISDEGPINSGYSINAGAQCNTLDISSNAPSIIPSTDSAGNTTTVFIQPRTTSTTTIKKIVKAPNDDVDTVVIYPTSTSTTTTTTTKSIKTIPTTTTTTTIKPFDDSQQTIHTTSPSAGSSSGGGSINTGIDATQPDRTLGGMPVRGGSTAGGPTRLMTSGGE